VIELKAEREDESRVRMVIEAKAWDSEKARPGRSAIGKSLNTAMTERDATLAVYVSRSHTGLAREIGEWAEGACERGSFVVTTEEHLTTAIRFLLVQHRLATARAAKRQIDMQAVDTQLARIRAALVAVKSINANITDGHGVLDKIQSAAEALRKDVRDALDSIEDALRSRATD
jgi:hypothetical protein